jgi:hypothetical protein
LKFLRYGVEFLTLRPFEKSDEGKPLSLTVKHRLPLAPATGTFQLTDYQKYELERESFFDSPAGRIAGCSGGTVARLWRKNTGRFNERVNDINKGPSEEALLGTGVRFFCGPNEEYYDDFLSEVMDAFICGQYLARERKFSFQLL